MDFQFLYNPFKTFQVSQTKTSIVGEGLRKKTFQNQQIKKMKISGGSLTKSNNIKMIF